MNKPESLIIEEATLEIQNAINEISKKYNLSFFILKIILNDFYKAILQEEDNQKRMYLELQQKNEDKKEVKIKNAN